MGSVYPSPSQPSTVCVIQHQTRLQMIPPSSLVLSSGMGADDPLLRATFPPANPLADIFHPPYPPIASQSISRDVPLTRARAFRFLILPFRGVAKVALYCARHSYPPNPERAETRSCPGEHILIVHVLRTRRAPGRSPFLPHLQFRLPTRTLMPSRSSLV